MRLYEPTPNESPGEIHDLAMEQLQLYQTIAETWGRYPDGNCVRCGKCSQAIYMRHDKHGYTYNYNRAEILALVVAHIRQVHEEVVDIGDE